MHRFLVYGEGTNIWYRHSRFTAVSDDDSADRMRSPAWDPRWLESAIVADDLDAVTELATTSSKALSEYLEAKFSSLIKRSARVYEIRNVVSVMIRIGHPQATDAWIQGMQKLNSKSSGYGLYWLTQLASELPKSEVAKIQTILPTLPDSAAEEIVAILAGP